MPLQPQDEMRPSSSTAAHHVRTDVMQEQVSTVLMVDYTPERNKATYYRRPALWPLVIVLSVARVGTVARSVLCGCR